MPPARPSFLPFLVYALAAAFLGWGEEGGRRDYAAFLPPQTPPLFHQKFLSFLLSLSFFYPASASRSWEGAADVLVVLFYFRTLFLPQWLRKTNSWDKGRGFFRISPRDTFSPREYMRERRRRRPIKKTFLLSFLRRRRQSVSPFSLFSPHPKLGLLGKGTPAHCCTKENGEKMDCRPCCCCIWDKNVLTLCS